MRCLPLPRRLLAVVAASAVALAGLVLAGSASAAGPCPTYTDDKGDAVPVNAALYPAIGEDDLDLLAVSHSVDSGIFTSVLKVTALSDTGPVNAFGDNFSALFTVAGKAVIMKSIRDTTAATPVVTTSLSVAGTATTAKVTAVYDTKASTVTLGTAVDELAKAVGAPLDGQAFTAMSARSGSWYPIPSPVPASGLAYDTATAPATAKYVFGGSCSGDAPSAGTVTPTPTATPTAVPGAPVLYDQPRKGCLQFPDATGDAATNPVSGGAGDTDSDLDITGVVYRTTGDALQAYVREKALSTGPSSVGGNVYDTHSFSTGFTIGGKAIAVTAEKSGPATATVGGTASTALHPTATFDVKNSTVVFSVPLTDLATLTGSAVTGAEVTALTAASAASGSVVPAPANTADTAAPATAAQKTYVVGSNTCFQPLPGKLFLDGDSGVYSDVTTMTASLLDASDGAVSGATLSVTVEGLPTMSAVTDALGDARFTFPVTVPAGARTASVSFLGTDAVGPVSLSQPFTVVVDKTVLKAVGGPGGVAATLTDNDKQPLAGRMVAFTVGGQVSKVKTNAKGQAFLKGIAKGTAVKVGFGGVPRYYAAAKTVSAKAG